MIAKDFTDVVLLLVKENHTFKYYHPKDVKVETFELRDGRILHVDLTKAYQLHGWVPWKDWNWRTPWSIAAEWLWKVDHRTALLIYPDTNVDEKSGVIEPITSFDSKAGDYEDMTPRGLEGFVESRIPVNYFKKWTTGSGKIAWWVWALLAVLIVLMFYMFVLRGG
jgi:hypothetical protein